MSRYTKASLEVGSLTCTGYTLVKSSGVLYYKLYHKAKCCKFIHHEITLQTSVLQLAHLESR